jgi:conjugal transfer pilus assembly protein TraF
MRNLAFLPFVILLILLCSPAVSFSVETPPSGTTASTGEYGRHDEGWFFYKDPREITEVKPLPRPLPLPGSASESKEPEKDKVGSVAWIRKNIDKIRDKAIDEPTKENLELFAYVQKMMMDKSEVFATKFVQTTSGDPALDENVSNPRSTAAKQSQYKEIDEAQNRVLEKLSKEVAIWYFFRSDCPYCAKADPILTSYLGHFGFSILPISTDGAPLADGAFPNWVPDQGQAAYLNVTMTPTLYIVHPPKDVILLAVGLKAGKELAERLIDVAHEEKWISDTEYDDAVRGLPRRYLTTAFDPAKISDPDNPEELLKAFRASGTFSAKTADLQEMSQAGADRGTPLHAPNKSN